MLVGEDPFAITIYNVIIKKINNKNIIKMDTSQPQAHTQGLGTH